MRAAFICFCALLALVVCGGAADAVTPEQATPVEVPFTFERGQIFVPVKINGLATTYQMQLNTGVARSVLSHAVATTSAVTTTVSNPNGANYDKNYSLQAIVKSLEVGKLRYANLDVAISVNSNAPGILGNDFLKQYVTQIDFRNRVIRFYEKSPFAKGVTSTEGMVILPLKLDGRERVPIIEEVYVNGKKIKATLDTGFAGTLALTPDAVKYLGLELAKETKSKVESRQLDSLMVGTLKIASPLAFLYSKGGGLDKSLSTLGGIIGNGMMENYTVTFDYQNKLVVFQ